MNAKAQNIQMVQIVATGLKDLLPEIVFVGGATIALYLSEKTAAEGSSVRPTDDVDCTLEVTTRAEYNKLEEQIRSLGFNHVTTQGAPVCRWFFSGVTVDIMPADPKIIGFSNRWYRDGIRRAVPFALPSGLSIQLFTIPYLLASKVEAFRDRGKGDFIFSRDFEDIITVIDGAENVRAALASSPNEVKNYLRDQFQKWCADDAFIQSLSAHLPNVRRNADGARRVLDIIKGL
jgi:predicted nucleotidyltransferase